MEKQIKKIQINDIHLFLRNKYFSLKGFVFFLIVLCSTTMNAQNQQVRGIVFDSYDEPLIGASVTMKGNPSVGTITNFDGEFSLSIPAGNHTLIISYIGMKEAEIRVPSSRPIRVVLEDDAVVMGEIIVVGYGQQKKESVVGAITQTNAKVLERSGGVSSLGSALTGNLPGVITYASSGMPGAEDPKIIIRTQSSWNSSDPLVLVDGIERPMSSVDISSVETVSVLKDASATAVYGVKGANGVILITTKRGKEGRANVQIRSSATAKVVSKLPAKYDAYDTFLIRNESLERELPLNSSGWSTYRPMQVIDKYRNPATPEEWDRYPNVDWANELFEDYAMSYNTSINVSGGTKLVKYFAAADILHEGDLFKNFSNNRGYETGYGFNRINVRSNLDFQLTKTTQFSANLFGSNATRSLPWAAGNNDTQMWASAYRTAPDAMRPIYSNGMWGYYAPRNADVPNSVYNLAVSGYEKRTTTQINTDFKLAQELDMITKGLNFAATFSMDNSFLEDRRGVNDLYNDGQRMWVDPNTGVITYQQPINGGTQLDFAESIRWSTQPGRVNLGQTYRRMYYSMQMNYARTFGKHDVTAMGLFSREQYARGSEFFRYREDWVFRATYGYLSRYFAEVNGAYNGSEKFGPNYRFDFFPSFSAGWMISEEPLMQKLTFLDMLKVRASWGRIGDDSVGGRWLYQDQWAFSGNAIMGATPANTPYTFYRISTLGNPDVSWETVEKRNFGLEYSFLHGIVAGSVDIFNDKRTNILVSGGSRAIPSYFGATPPVANLGSVKSKGYELELRSNYVFSNGLRLWGNANMTHATNKVLFRDDPELYAAHRKGQGYAIDQSKVYIDEGFIGSWDDLYGSTQAEANNQNKLVGDLSIIDFNGDGVINADDQAPYQYSGVPQNTYSASVGVEWKGLSFHVQFYGVNNVSRQISFPSFHSTSNVAFVEGTYWTKDGGGDISYPRITTNAPTGSDGTRYWYDGSYLRLKNAEIAYTLSGKWIEKLKLKSCRIFLNGDNLFLWTKMPDDRESNFSGDGGSSFGAYPTVRRFNLGFDITL